jgi:hypothetical protein
LEGYILRKGDLIIASAHTGLVTKITARYIYYFLLGSISRIKKESVWLFNDTKDEVSLIYGSKNRRRLQRKMRTLDLHRIRHTAADEKIRSFLNFVELPCKIVTGKSDKMKAIVKTIVEEYEWSCREEDNWDCGTLVVTEK